MPCQPTLREDGTQSARTGGTSRAVGDGLTDLSSLRARSALRRRWTTGRPFLTGRRSDSRRAERARTPSDPPPAGTWTPCLKHRHTGRHSEDGARAPSPSSAAGPLWSTHTGPGPVPDPSAARCKQPSQRRGQKQQLKRRRRRRRQRMCSERTPVRQRGGAGSSSQAGEDTAAGPRKTPTRGKRRCCEVRQ